MNKREIQLFNALSLDREENARVFKKTSVNVMPSIVDKYSEQAHFIYELLQNADDACATSAKFILTQQHLIFIHDGKRHFSISDPATEDEDRANGKLGDINAITAIGLSTKTTDATIGKFGVGFKSVFQYTRSPHIYDSNCNFKIEDYVVPRLIDDDMSDLYGRRNDETMFCLPFNPDGDGAQTAYEDIALKLRNLNHPLLFLQHLQTVSYECDDFKGSYTKQLEKSYAFGDTTAEHILLHDVVELFDDEDDYVDDNDECVYEEDGDDDESNSQLSIWLFSRQTNKGHRYCVGFFADGDGYLFPAAHFPAFCFFPTQVATNLNFIVHAPFQLTDSREGIKGGNKHNDEMIACLAKLAADAIVLLRQIGETESKHIIDDAIIKVIPWNSADFSTRYASTSFRPFYEAVVAVFKTRKIIPTRNGYTTKDNAYWASNPDIVKLFSDEQLAALYGNESAHFVFTTRGRDETKRNAPQLCAFIDSIVNDTTDDASIANHIDSAFIEAQETAWLHDFYRWISNSKERQKMFKEKPIFINREGRATRAFDESGNAILFLPYDCTQIPSDYPTVHPSLIENEETKKILKDIGISEPTQWDFIYKYICPKFHDSSIRPQTTSSESQLNDAIAKSRADFGIVFDFYCNACLSGTADSETKFRFLDELRNCTFLVGIKTPQFQERKLFKATDLYMPTSELKHYLEIVDDQFIVDTDFYRPCIGERQTQFEQFLTALGCMKDVACTSTTTTVYPPRIGRTQLQIDNQWPDPEYRCYYEPMLYIEPSIVGSEKYVEYIESHGDMARSLLLWNVLLQRPSQYPRSFNDELTGKCHYRRQSSKKPFYVMDFTSHCTRMLRNGKWLFDKNGNAKSPNELTKDVLNPAYDIDASAASKLFKFLGIADSKDDKFARVEAILDESNFSIRDKENTMFAMEIVNDGFTKEDYEAFKAWKRINEIATPAPITAYTNSRKAYTSTTNTKTDDASESTEQSDTPDERISSLDRILRELEAQYRVISDNQTDDASESTEQSDAPDECESSLGRILREIEARRLEQIEKRPKADGDDQIDDDVTIDSRDEQFLYLIETAKYHFDALRNILNEIKRLYIS